MTCSRESRNTASSHRCSTHAIPLLRSLAKPADSKGRPPIKAAIQITYESLMH